MQVRFDSANQNFGISARDTLRKSARVRSPECRLHVGKVEW